MASNKELATTLIQLLCGLLFIVVIIRFIISDDPVDGIWAILLLIQSRREAKA